MKAIFTHQRTLYSLGRNGVLEIVLDDENGKEEIVEVLELFVGGDRDKAAILNENGKITFVPIGQLRFNPNDFVEHAEGTKEKNDWPDYP